MTDELVAERRWEVTVEAEYWADEDAHIIERKVRRPGVKGVFCRRRRVRELVVRPGATPTSRRVERGNLLLDNGVTRLLNLLIGSAGGSPQAYDATHARIGVGDSSTGAVSSQTDLQASSGATHRQFETMTGGYPTVSGQTVSFQALYSSGEANFTAGIQEWCIDIGTAAGTTNTTPVLNRKVASLGTKVSGTLTLTVSITFS